MSRSLRSTLSLGVLILCFVGVMAPGVAKAQASDEAQITSLLETQAEAWNRGDLTSFMAGYWKSDETVFVGAGGITRGWQAVLERYQKAYPDRKTMGRLSFTKMEVHQVCADGAFVIGEFHLERENDKPSGIFTLNFRKFPEGWRIVADHTTAFAQPPVTK
ncbi:MAG TPA: nuclear transport factor 2 family protein [Candidatus Acidoferrales bacterium]